MGTTKVRNQEKGVLAKAVSAEFRVTPKERKNTRGSLGPAAHLAFTASLPRKACIFAKAPFQSLFFWEGDATKHFAVKKRFFFSEKGGGNSVNEGS